DCGISSYDQASVKDAILDAQLHEDHLQTVTARREELAAKRRRGYLRPADDESELMERLQRPACFGPTDGTQASPRNTRFGSPLGLSRVHWVRPQVAVEVIHLTRTGLLRAAHGPISRSPLSRRNYLA